MPAAQNIIDYKIKQQPTPFELEAEVRHLIREGWQPLGPMVISPDKSGGRFLQTMVKYEVKAVS